MISDVHTGEAFAISSGFVQLVLAFLFLKCRQYEKNWGFGWMSATMFAAAIINLSSPQLITPYLSSTSLNDTPVLTSLFLLTVGFGCLASLAVGVRIYTSADRRPQFKRFAIILAGLIVALFALHPFSNKTGDLLSTLVMIYCAFLSAKSAIQERTVGNVLLAVFFLGQPAVFFTLLLVGFTRELPDTFPLCRSP